MLYIGRIYTALISLALIPQIIKIVGYDAYGLVGFFVVVQACLGILEAGIGGVLTRESIASQVNKELYNDFLTIFNKIFLMFVFIGVLIAVLGWIISNNYALEWIKSDLNNREVILCVFIMFVTYAFKYVQSPYMSILLSSEKHILISIISIISITISQPIALITLYFISNNIVSYFIVQLLAAIVSMSLLLYFGNIEKNKILKRLPNKISNTKNKKINVKDILITAFQLSSLSILWIVVNQSDKLILTKVITIKEYAFYSIAFTVTIIIRVLNEPLNQFLQSRLSKLYCSKNYADYSALFFKSFCYISIIVIPLTIFICFNGNSLIYIWSNDFHLSKEVNKYLPFIFIGVVFSLYSNFGFILRYSTNNIKSHAVFYTIFSIIVIPLNILIAYNYHAEGSSLFFAISCGFLFFSWTLYNISSHFENGLKLFYFLILPLVIISILSFYLYSLLSIAFENKTYQFLYLFIQGLTCVFLCWLFFDISKKSIRLKFKSSKL